MTNSPEPDAVDPALRRAAAEAGRRLEAACDDLGEKDLSQESLDELLRLEDELLAAARAVDETARIRRQLGEQRASAPAPRAPSVPDAPVASSGETRTCRLREFQDVEGSEWYVWEVRPGSSGRRINPERYLGEYVGGWLAFECPQKELRKRLPNHPADWFAMANEALSGLLPGAVEVPKRRPKGAV